MVNQSFSQSMANVMSNISAVSARQNVSDLSLFNVSNNMTDKFEVPQKQLNKSYVENKNQPLEFQDQA